MPQRLELQLDMTDVLEVSKEIKELCPKYFHRLSEFSQKRLRDLFENEHEPKEVVVVRMDLQHGCYVPVDPGHLLLECIADLRRVANAST